MSGAAPTVYIVDDAREVRMALSRLLGASGYQVSAFESAERFLEEQDAEAPGCLLLDVCMPGLSGIELQRTLAGLPCARPIVFLSGKDDVQIGVHAMKAGYQVNAFESAERFLEEQDAEAPGCLLLDVCMPGLSGIELQRTLAGLPCERPLQLDP